jgi:deoxyribodipyrimidine photolyase-like uncharacterized protein
MSKLEKCIELMARGFSDHADIFTLEKYGQSNQINADGRIQSYAWKSDETLTVLARKLTRVFG